MNITRITAGYSALCPLSKSTHEQVSIELEAELSSDENYSNAYVHLRLAARQMALESVVTLAERLLCELAQTGELDSVPAEKLERTFRHRVPLYDWLQTYAPDMRVKLPSFKLQPSALLEDTQEMPGFTPPPAKLCSDCGQPLDDYKWCVNPKCDRFIPF